MARPREDGVTPASMKWACPASRPRSLRPWSQVAWAGEVDAQALAMRMRRAAHVDGGGDARVGGGVRSAGTGSGRISPRASSITSIGVRPSRLTVHSPAMGA